MRKIINLSIIILITSCGLISSKQKSLDDSVLLIETFNKEELIDLSKILTFFDNQILSSFKSKNIVESYDLFNSRNLELKEDGLIFGNIQFSEQKELYNSINESTFNEIWDLGKSTNNDGKTRNIVFINPIGKYANYLQKLGVQNSFIENYINTIESSYDIPPTILYAMIDNYNKFDISDESIRLIIAIHYLTLNDNLHDK